jgi:hypothetical protein
VQDHPASFLSKSNPNSSFNRNLERIDSVIAIEAKIQLRDEYLTTQQGEDRQIMSQKTKQYGKDITVWTSPTHERSRVAD